MGYNSAQILLRYIGFFIKSKTRYSVHSPFVFSLIENVLKKQAPFYAYKKIENRRDELYSDKTQIEIKDLGAGSRLKKNRKISEIASNALSPSFQSEWLFGIVNFFKPTTVVELGTSLGVSSAYLASANPNAVVYTLEGSPELVEIAQNGWKKLKLDNIYPLIGSIDETLPHLIQKIKGSIDLLFMDANHTYEATIIYYNKLKPKFTANTIVIVDDIHWSRGMEKAWKEIIESTDVSISIDLFYKGIIFFKKDIKKEHFILRV